jgi:hypothetical protein
VLFSKAGVQTLVAGDEKIAASNNNNKIPKAMMPGDKTRAAAVPERFA